MKTWPTLYKLNTQGTIEQWKIEVHNKSDLQPTIKIEYGEHDGKLQIKNQSVFDGKNLGRSNATTAIEQAIAEAQSKFNKKLKSGYVKSLKAAREGKVDKVIKGGMLPMKAAKWEDVKRDFPYLAQPKLDGEFCKAICSNKKWTLWTRSRKQITSCPHIIKELNKLLPYHTVKLFLVGELYIHGAGKKNFEAIMSAVRKKKPTPESAKIQLHLFDCGVYDPETMKAKKQVFINRHWFLSSKVPRSKIVKVIPIKEIKNKKEADKFYEACLNDHYEGSMFRKSESSYEHKRSKNLLKRKPLDDAEFEIIGVKAGKDSTVIFECVNEHGKKFKATMNGDKKANQKYLSRDGKLKVIGKMLTVEYQGLTGKNGVPRFPQAKRIRVEV